MKRLTFIPLVASLLMATTAFAEVDKIKEVVVSIDLGAVTNPAAALRYAKVADDLQGAIAARVVDVNQAKGFFPQTVDLTKLRASSDEYYAAMITAFADAVVRRLD